MYYNCLYYFIVHLMVIDCELYRDQQSSIFYFLIFNVHISDFPFLSVHYFTLTLLRGAMLNHFKKSALVKCSTLSYQCQEEEEEELIAPTGVYNRCFAFVY